MKLERNLSRRDTGWGRRSYEHSLGLVSKENHQHPSSIPRILALVPSKESSLSLSSMRCSILFAVRSSVRFSWLLLLLCFMSLMVSIIFIKCHYLLEAARASARFG
jgi:hypothetical protein